MRAMHQQFTASLEGSARQNVEVQNELAHSRQQAANESLWTRVWWGKTSDFSGAQDAWRDWSTVFKGYAGAAMPRLQKLMDSAAKVKEPTPNATILG